MRRPLAVLIITFAALAGTAVAHAPARHHGVHHRRVARANPIHRVIEMSDVGANAEAPSRSVAPSPGEAPWRTSVEYRLAHGRVTGQLGYNRASGAYEINPHEVNSAAATQLGHPDDTMGAKVSIPF
jgi:hypothetical protein